jgi:hypothetical protein
MEITISTYDELLTFIKRNDIDARAAIDVFESAFNPIVVITFVDPLTREPHLNKGKIITKIEEFIDNCLKGKHDKVVLFS